MSNKINGLLSQEKHFKDNPSLLWNPEASTIIKMCGDNKEIAFKAFRVSSTVYTSKKYVRIYTHARCNGKCVKCGSKKDIHMDHIKSVRNCFDSRQFFLCNSISNLQLLCSVCNLKKGKQNV